MLPADPKVEIGDGLDAGLVRLVMASSTRRSDRVGRPPGSIPARVVTASGTRPIPRCEIEVRLSTPELPDASGMVRTMDGPSLTWLVGLYESVDEVKVGAVDPREFDRLPCSQLVSTTLIEELPRRWGSRWWWPSSLGARPDAAVPRSTRRSGIRWASQPWRRGR
jgi:hypothetical protein